MKLIKEGQVAGRIDSHAKVLHARRSDARRDSFQAALAAGASHSQLQSRLCRWRCAVMLQQQCQPRCCTCGSRRGQ